MATRKPQMKKKCLCCPNKAQSRGLCWACNRDALAEIESGKSTEQQLIDRGMILPRAKSGRKPSSGFASKISRSLKTKSRKP